MFSRQDPRNRARPRDSASDLLTTPEQRDRSPSEHDCENDPSDCGIDFQSNFVWKPPKPTDKIRRRQTASAEDFKGSPHEGLSFSR
ncbi:hypothetical protein L596_015451 [Steinernema carpocapsae]|uniref:Uncharacterized protein n=1 Tax=Steinernema carpocapsae TaxID=34508 RepID=A0A4U5NFW2_STECR|nr:hypothetical protein L596_015451 [Steinernema carpocapsae]